MLLKRSLVAALLLANLLLSGCYPFLPDLPISQTSSNDAKPTAAAPISPEQKSRISTSPVAGWTTFTKNSGVLGNDNVQTITQDEQGNLWIGTRNGGVSRYNGKEWQSFSVRDGLTDNNIHVICPDGNGNVWFGTDAGASSYDGQHWFTYTDKDGLVGSVVQFIFKDNKGNLWLSTNSGLANRRCPAYYGVFRFDGSSWVNFTRQSTLGGLASDMVNAIEQDRQGNLWFGTNLGVSRYDGQNWQTYTKSRGLSDNNVLSLEHDTRGNIWVGTPGYGVSRFDGKNWQTFTKSEGLAGNYVVSILADDHDNVWFGTEEGVSCFDGTNWRTFTSRDGLADEQVRCIFQDEHGNIWFGTYTNGVSRFEAN